VTADHRSAHPNIPGVPWWGAVLLAVTAAAIGFAYDAGSGTKELSLVFAASYVVGCIIAVLAVRQTGIFTAVIQPPLILFVAVPTAYFLFHGSQVTGIKDLAINCGYPLVERFPLMFFTSAGVLLIGMARWYYAMSTRRPAPRSKAKESTNSSLISKVSSLLTREPTEDDAGVAESPRRKHTAERRSRPKKAAAANTNRKGRPTKRATPSQSRHARPPETEIIEPVAERPRRPRSTRQTEQPPAAEPRRRPRKSSTPRKAAPPPDDRRASYERTERRRRFDDYPPREPHGANGNGTHHPVSRVRYRGGADDAENPAEYRTPRRSRRDREADSWEFDI
jgi:pyruvate/2-oxoglutarate dehydrogenase complex dihydrolipoamide acyltransferase (E2) component